MQFIGSLSCDKTVRRLIKKAANRFFADGDLPLMEKKNCVSLPATKSSMQEYYQLERFADREEFHARLQTYLNADAVEVEWDSGAGDRGQLKRIILINPQAAADILSEELPWVVAEKAIQDLKDVVKEGLPPIDHITEAWRKGKSSGGIPAERGHQFVDSLRVIDAAQRLVKEGKDVLLRRLSATLFGDTKRIEALSRQISFILGEQNELEEDDVFSRLGLVKHPQPMLLSGSSIYSVQLQEMLIPLAYPYLGFRPDTVYGLQNTDASIRRILTIENLASFNEAAEDRSRPSDLLLVYVAGNPTPSLLAAYNRILQSIKPSIVMHWGDIDLGGFRIAARLADSVRKVDHQLKLWQMNPLQVAPEKEVETDTKKIEAILKICQRYGWNEEFEGVSLHPAFQEQEFLAWVPPRA